MMESLASFSQDIHQQPSTSQPLIFSQPLSQQSEDSGPPNSQANYQVKCGLLEYHLQEAVLINKALRSELQQYKEKIDFEKKLRKYLDNRLRGSLES